MVWGWNGKRVNIISPITESTTTLRFDFSHYFCIVTIKDENVGIE